MIDSQLNLLSPNKKIKLRRLVQDIFIKEILEVIMFTVSVLSIFFLIGWITLIGFMTTLAASTTAINSDANTHNQQIVQVNSAIHKIIAVSSDFVPLTPYLMELANNLPNDIRLNSLRISRTDQAIYISGVAKTRDVLLNYQNNLDKITWISNFNIPPSQLFQKDNVGFEVRGKLGDLFKLKTNQAVKKVNSTSND